ncbi:MAG: DUF1573 domain-containing protein [Chthoniobacteraceae bacterium]
MNALTRSLVVAALLWTTADARAELVWDTKEVHLKAALSDTEVIARFPFKNTGGQSVKFKSFKSACGCVTIEASTMEVAPGSTGDVKVVFTPEFRQGKQKRPIAVQFDDEKQTRTALYLHVELPEVIRPQPIFLRWGPEETLGTKEVTLEVDADQQVESMTVLPSNPLWETKVSPAPKGRDYVLQVTPKGRRGTQSKYVEVEARLANGQVKRTNVYVVVR